MRAAIAHDLKEINVQHLFIVKLSAIDSHQNHYIGPRISSAETLTDVCAHHFEDDDFLQIWFLLS